MASNHWLRKKSNGNPNDIYIPMYCVSTHSYSHFSDCYACTASETYRIAVRCSNIISGCSMWR